MGLLNVACWLGKINVLSACLIDLYFLELDRGRETRRKLRPA